MSSTAPPGADAPAQPRERESHRKAEILRISAELFARNGYHATGVAEIGQAVGLGKGALYHHIGSKDLLLYEIVNPPMLELLAYAEEILVLDISAAEKLRRISRRLMRTIADNLPEFTVFFAEGNALTGERRTELLGVRTRFEEILVAILEEGHEAGHFRTSDPIVIKGVLGMHNYSYLWLRPAGPLSPESISDKFCDLLLSGLLTSAGREGA